MLELLSAFCIDQYGYTLSLGVHVKVCQHHVVGCVFFLSFLPPKAGHICTREIFLSKKVNK